MFEWLQDEMTKVKTRKFFLVDGPLRPDKRELVERSKLLVPPSYTSFVLKFGNAKLYRGAVDQYRVEVFAVPRAIHSQEHEPLLYFGRTDRSRAYFKEDLLVPGSETPVFEWRHEQAIHQTGTGFEEWLRKKCEWARRTFTKKEWRAIEKGPLPFNDQEQAIVEARRKFRWRVVGISSTGGIQFEVHNGSDVVLPFLSVGIRGKRRGTDATLNGGVWLPVGSVLPDQTAVIEKDCYKEWVDPQNVEAFEAPDPEPEDRDRYWEFKPLPR
jgi:hypothetical protein